ncbi:MAG: hypothetical protein HQ510_06635 [Candidatus Marinimicrobia bacterium]|nr:hypothetical protein [Candidatus Neomarinimicrobiota bacterium]
MTVSTHLKQMTVILMIVMSTFSFAVQITFQVDMQFQDVSPDGVHIAGTFQGWNPEASECTLVSDAIYAATFELNPGDYHEYKFVNGNAWGTDENVQRNITVPAENTILDPVFFNDYEVVEGSEPVNVTFHLNTSTMPGWTDSTHSIVIRGNLNGWGGNNWELMNVGGDYWSYTTVTPLDPGNYEYKYVNLAITGDEWESTDNRYLIVTGLDGDQHQPIDYFNAEGPPYVETDGLDVYFRVSTLSICDYAGEDMFLAGSFEGWTGILMTDEGTGEFWGLSYSFDVPTHVEYKFQYGIGGWEGIDNRIADITQDTTLAFVWWYAPWDPPPLVVTKMVIFQVDMTEWLDEEGSTGMPVFSFSRNDTIEVRGGFNGWNDNDPAISVMVRQPGTNIFSLPVSITNYSSLTNEYRYFIKHSAESVSQLESEYGPLYPDMGWGDSPQYGGSNRTFSLGDTDDDIYQLPLAGYYDLPVGGTIPTGQQIITTYTIDMSDAGTSGFVPGDEVRLVLKDKWTNYLQGFSYVSSTVASDNGDGTYTAIVTLTGPAPWHTLYVWEFEGANLSVQEGGGFDYGKYRVRYMCPSDGVWGDWEYPVDIWTEDPPLLVEDFQGALECLGACIADGDVNGDGTVDVSDIVELICSLLIIDCFITGDLVCQADLDGSGSLDILDIVIMVDIILNSSN